MAAELAKRSLCVRDQVGAVIVDAQNKIIGEGYNGPPRGYEHLNQPCTSWCPRAAAAQWRAAEGPYSEGAADFPAWAQSSFHGPNPDYSDCPSLHAEANALLLADRSLCAGGAIFVTSHVCFGCAKLIANSGLAYVVVRSAAREHRPVQATLDFLAACGVYCKIYEEIV